MKMKSIRDWVFAQLVSGSFVLPRPLSSSSLEEPQNEEFVSSGSTQNVDVVASQETADMSSISSSSQENPMYSSSQQILVDNSSPSYSSANRTKLDRLSKIEALQIDFFRILQRLRQSPEDILVAKVLYRIHLATLIRAGESDLNRVNLRSDKARALAAEQEAAQQPALDFSLRILVLGKTGVGKSATINSLFNQTKTVTNAFKPATDHIQEVTGSVNDIKVTVIDTPGFLPSSTLNVRRNRKIILSIKRYIQKNPPDVVLYLERLDAMSKGYNDFPLLRLMTEVFGPAMWFNTILVMTNAAAALPEGPSGSPVNYESYVTHCTDLLQRYIQLAVSDAKLENPVVLAENHSTCRTNTSGERVLPNGQVWKQQLLLLCMCTKVLGDANSLLGLQNSIELGPSNNSRLPSLPHLLSAFLRQRPVMTDGEVDEYSFSDSEEDDEYDQLPPIRILTKRQFQKLSDSQKKDYLDELDYRETLFLKKQLKEESRKRKEKKLLGDKCLPDEGNTDDPEALPEAVQLPDIAVPPSFDCNSPIYRYRGVLTSDRWLWRPVLDPQGWDHDVGFDGVNLETAVEIKRNLTASVSGQMSKDKNDFSIHSECAASYTDPKGPTYSAGLDIQSSGQDMLYTVRSHAKSGKWKHNVGGCGVSVISFQNKYYVGSKLENVLHIGKRLKLEVNAGQLVGAGQAAYGGNLEATITGRDYPVRNDKVSMAMNVLSFKKELVLGGSFESEFRPSRGIRLSVNANLNSRNMGKVSVKTSSSEHVEIALIALLTIVRALCRKREPHLLGEDQEVG
ncbi:translocase of chloroplast 90, chloroplastic isoform X1 [Beta vulgaris subsp. vulgaris]|uniref:translocase of chloroplast 90, chloroplastic isoform X1 n=2 Tax=Beta vulgaris subsp. vulgaris TaxID=3555 RepID=UPI00053F9C97|nr:translocase of chloroplast 90, chloroplastic isoform X1 [Beta vulgaris subsp. vulgaris]